MIFVCGIHGVGKTEYCRQLAEENGISAYSASELINNVEKKTYERKQVNDISSNQKILIDQVNKIKVEKDNFILDGHMCLINKKGHFELVKEEVFRLLGIDCIVVLIDSPSIICKRLIQRDGEYWNKEWIERFQRTEVNYAWKVARHLGVEFKIIKISEKEIKKKAYFNKNIILPIKPLYVEEILNNNKKYEYRKHICVENIDKIYLYATAPVKALLGEAEVLEKIVMNKEKLWDITKEESGISKEYYDEYFSKSQTASAYRLGEIRRYKKPIELNDVGIMYAPQSYIYVDNLFSNGEPES